MRREDSRRSRALVAFVLAREAREGHTVTARDTVVDALREFSWVDADTAIDAALEAGAGRRRRRPSCCRPTRLAEAEDGVAEGISRAAAAAEPITAKVAETGLDDAQRDAVESALREGVSVLTGGPGTGKSRTVATLVSLAEKAGKSVALAAPTGRAAKRLEELCNSPASTLHRLLGAQPRQSGDDVSFDGRFARGEDWPLDEDVVVVDEASMLDVELAEALLSACSDGTHLVFVGDAAQLPSIGPGRVLGDLIESGAVHVTELTTLYRQAVGGSIARLAAAVRGGELPPVSDPTHEVVIVPARGSAEAAHRVVQLVTDSIPRALGVPSDQVQVVTPVHRGGAGTQALNAVLKKALNPGAGRGRFDAGDRVVATANHPEAEPVGYANGEVGTVDQVRARRDRRRRVRGRPRGGQGQGAGRPAARLGDHRAPGAGFGVPGRRGRAAARGERDALPSVGVHGADPRAEAPVGRARRRAGRDARGAADRHGAAAHPAGRAAVRRLTAFGGRSWYPMTGRQKRREPQRRRVAGPASDARAIVARARRTEIRPDCGSTSSMNP